MMFLNNHLIALFCKFLWWGLIFGFLNVVCKIVIKAFKKNVYVSNLVSFCFWLAFGGVFVYLSVWFYDYRFCWFGLLGMFFGSILVKFSIEFFFTKFAKLLYNKHNKLKTRKS